MPVSLSTQLGNTTFLGTAFEAFSISLTSQFVSVSFRGAQVAFYNYTMMVPAATTMPTMYRVHQAIFQSSNSNIDLSMKYFYYLDDFKYTPNKTGSTDFYTDNFGGGIVGWSAMEWGSVTYSGMLSNFFGNSVSDGQGLFSTFSTNNLALVTFGTNKALSLSLRTNNLEESTTNWGVYHSTSTSF